MARVLVVEDSPTQAAEIRFLLEDAGFDVDVAVDGVEALSSLHESLPDLIVTDLQMPRMDGLALVEAVKSKHPAVPVVLITAHGSEEIAARRSALVRPVTCRSGTSVKTSPTSSAKSSRWPHPIRGKSVSSKALKKRGSDCADE